jgi:hypothetical protein
MKKTVNKTKTPDMFPEYDFRHGIRGKHARGFWEGSNIVALDPRLKKVFPTSESVNTVLGALADVFGRWKKAA